MSAKQSAINNDDLRARLWSRREVIRQVSAMLGGTALVGQVAMLAGCERKEQAAAESAETVGNFSAADIELLAEISETILPETGTPGARAAGVGPFIALMVTDTYDPDERRQFSDGLQAIENRCRSDHGVGFLKLSPEQRLALVKALDQEQFDAMQRRQPGAPVHYFRMLKELTLLGYFTSEIGYTQAMRYAETPGRYDPCTPLAPDDTAWATHA